jgi:50S ribosomal subunit-associated GTPase HflX
VLVADKLFATLDTTVHALWPESRPRILFSDTVGFIKKLPHDLVASFRSTLDEALVASLLLQIVDAADPVFRAQIQVTREVLDEIGAGDVPWILVLNKIDKVAQTEREELLKEFPAALLVSAKDPADVRRVRTRSLGPSRKMTESTSFPTAGGDRRGGGVTRVRCGRTTESGRRSPRSSGWAMLRRVRSPGVRPGRCWGFPN